MKSQYFTKEINLPSGGTLMEIKKVTFNDFPNCYEIHTKNEKMILTSSFGPRILYFGNNNTGNILFNEANPLKKKIGFHLYGGHRFWLAPETQFTARSDDRPCLVEQKDNYLKITSYDPQLHFEKTLRITEKNNRFSVEHIFVNKGRYIFPASLWGLTCVPPEGIVFFPWNTTGSWKLSKIIYWQRWTKQKTNISSNQFVPTPDLFLIKPNGDTGKVGTAGYEGFVGITNKNYTFIKKFNYVDGASYPDDNCAIEVYTCKYFIELETLSPIYMTEPNHPYVHTEEWILIDKAINPEDGIEIRKLL